MQFTFKHQERERSLPFLQRFKNKINRVDRFSGLVGALGIPAKPTKEKMKNKTRFYTETNEHKLSSQISKKSNSVYSHTRNADIVINRFKTHADQQQDIQQNIDVNVVNESSKQFKESEKRQNFTKDFDIDELERKNEALKALILPKIGGTSIQVSNAESQLKIHRAKQYQKYRNMKLTTKRNIPLASLR